MFLQDIWNRIGGGSQTNSVEIHENVTPTPPPKGIQPKPVTKAKPMSVKKEH